MFLHQVRLDYEVRVPNEIGFSSILPNVSLPHVLNRMEWTLFINTTRPYWDYRGDREVLGFDPAGNMLYIARTANASDAFLAWMPEDALLPDEDREPVEYTDTTTVMSGPLRRASWALLAYVMMKSHYQDITFVHTYPDITDEVAFKNQCSILYVGHNCVSVPALPPTHNPPPPTVAQTNTSCRSSKLTASNRRSKGTSPNGNATLRPPTKASSSYGTRSPSSSPSNTDKIGAFVIHIRTGTTSVSG